MAKVAVVECRNYDIENVYSSLNKGIEMLGGFSKFFKKNEKILLKPNILFARTPDKATTTNPSVFEAVVRICLEFGIKPIYGDSPGFGRPYLAAKKSGFVDVGDKYKIEFGDFENCKTIRNKLNTKDFNQFNIVNAVLDSDGIINIPKMKAHQLTRITGAVKNLFGCIYGFHKAAFHAKFQIPIIFSKLIAEIAMNVRPRLNIMDGIIAMEGNGPSSGDLIKMNVLLISDDPVALDTVFCRIIKLDPGFIVTNTHGRQIGLGTYLDNEIELVGDPLEKFYNKKFKVVRRPLRDNRSISTKFGFINLILPKPVIKKDKCKKCGICISACPLEKKAINFKIKGKPPVYNYDICIKCYCCQELCPHEAIYVKNNILSRILLRT